MTHMELGEHTSYWMATSMRTAFPRLEEDVRVDVAVVGGGIVGVTAAYLLAKAGRSVVVLDRGHILEAQTAHSTAHLQIPTDTRLSTLVPRVGLDRAKLAWDGNMEAVRLIESIVEEERISCGFERLDGVLFTPRKLQRRLLKREARLTRAIGHAVEEAPPESVPFPTAAALRYPHQGKVHPRQYLLTLAQKAAARGVQFYEQTEATDVRGGEPACVCTASGVQVTADWVVAATHSPFHTRVRLHARLRPFRSYVVAARVPGGVFPDALYWDTLDPFHYVRVEREGERDLVIIGGEDRHTGDEENTDERYGALLAYLRQASPDVEPAYRWSAQDLETEDELPCIGATPGHGSNELVATGFGGTGITWGSLAAWMLTERILGRGTAWDEVFDPTRFARSARVVARQAKKMLSDSAHLVGGMLLPGDVHNVHDLAPGEGGILRQGARKVAVCRTLDGEVCAVRATCTHLGCMVGWNQAEQSWDCPCHGSRFSPKGDVLDGPAKRPLAREDVARVRQDEPTVV